MKNDLVSEKNEDSETGFFGVQLSQVVVHKSQFQDIPAEEITKTDNSISLGLSIEVGVETIEAHLSLGTENRFFEKEHGGPHGGFTCNFCVRGIFMHESMNRKELEDFSTYVIFGTLLPYAREYHGDITRRVGYPYAPVPIMNPQAVIKDMLSRDVLDIDFEEFDDFQQDS